MKKGVKISVTFPALTPLSSRKADLRCCLLAAETHRSPPSPERNAENYVKVSECVCVCVCVCVFVPLCVCVCLQALGEVTHHFFGRAGCRKSSAAGQADLGAAPLLSSRLCGESSHLERGSPTRLGTKNPRSALTSTPDHLTLPFLRLGVYNREFKPFYFILFFF